MVHKIFVIIASFNGAYGLSLLNSKSIYYIIYYDLLFL